MKSLFIKKAVYIFTYMLFAVVMEFITFNAMGLGIFPENFMMDFSIIAILGVIIFILPSFNLQAIFIMIFLGAQTILGFVNQSLYKYGGNVFSFDMLSLGAEVGGAYNPSFVSYSLLFGLIAVFLIEFGILFALKSYRVKQNFKLNTVINLIVVFAFSQIISSSIYSISVEKLSQGNNSDKYQILDDDAYLYDSLFIKHKAFKKFGTYSFYYKNLNRIIKANENLSKEEEQKKLNTNLAEVNEFLKNSSYNTANEYSGIFKGDNLVIVMIESGEWYGINSKFTPTLYAMTNQGFKCDNYYSKNKTNHSEILSLLGSYPLESVFTKNLLYKNDLLNNDFSFSLPSILKNSGYQTTFLHNNFASYYSREKTHPVFGFENDYFLEDMAGLKGSGLLEGHPKKVVFEDFDQDSLMFSTNLDKIAPNIDINKPFFTYLTTVMSHGGYDDLITYGDYTKELSSEKKKIFSDRCIVKNLEPYYLQITRDDFNILFESLGIDLIELEKEYGEKEVNNMYLRYKRYQASLMDLDKGLEALVKDLQDKNRFENTSIVMFGDHSAYYNQLNYYLKGNTLYSEKDSKTYMDYQPNIYKVPLYFYNGSMGFDNGKDELKRSSQVGAPKSKTISKFMSTFDIVPTILDLYGYNFNLGMYHGYSAFSDKESIVYSMESGMFNDKVYTMDGNNFLYGEKDKLEIDQFKDGLVNYIEKQRILEKMYKYDFFKYKEEYENANLDKVYKLK